MKKLIASLLLLFATGAFGAGSLVLPQFGGTGVVNASTKTITLGGPLVTSGAYTTTLTVTGTTGVTLPTTGTLATLGGTEELTGKTLDSSVGKGTWTASWTWTLPAVTLGGGAVIAASQALTGTVANSTISGFLSIAATTGTFTNVGGTLSTATQNSVTTMTGLTTTGALNAGSITSGFGSIDVGADAISGGAITGTSFNVNSYSAGTWTTPAFSAGDFTASGSMTWTVAAGDVITYEYTIINKMMTVNFYINTSTVGGTPNNELQIKIPASKVATSRVRVPYTVTDNGTTRTSMCEVLVSGTVISLYADLAISNWAAATDATSAIGSITFQIN